MWEEVGWRRGKDGGKVWTNVHFSHHFLMCFQIQQTYSHPHSNPPTSPTPTSPSPTSPTPTFSSSSVKKSIATSFRVFQGDGHAATEEIAGQGKAIPQRKQSTYHHPRELGHGQYLHQQRERVVCLPNTIKLETWTAKLQPAPSGEPNHIIT